MIRALFGGSFDPVHAGHVALTVTLLERSLADVVHVAPAGRSPHKTGGPAPAAAADRLDLVRLAFAGLDRVIVDDRELARPGPSYTIDTLAELAAEFPADRWRLVMGADQAAAFDRWREPRRVLDLAEPVVIARGPIRLAAPLLERALVVDDFRHPASATAIRADLAAGRLPGPDILPGAVAEAIVRRRLYGWPGGGAGGPKEHDA